MSINSDYVPPAPSSLYFRSVCRIIKFDMVYHYPHLRYSRTFSVHVGKVAGRNA